MINNKVVFTLMNFNDFYDLKVIRVIIRVLQEVCQVFNVIIKGYCVLIVTVDFIKISLGYEIFSVDGRHKGLHIFKTNLA